MKIRRAVTLMADGYEILRPVSGKNPFFGADAMMGKPHVNEQTFQPYRLTAEVFERYRAAGWIKRERRGRSQWELWRITETGLAEAKRQPEPSREELRAARKARTAVDPAPPPVYTAGEMRT